MTDQPRVQANLRLRAADGTPLATDVYLPATDTPVPAVVTRTCYGRGAHLAEGLGWARHGFAYVVQDVRGRYDSGGTWCPYRGERSDGAATAGWITGQPWSDGRLVPLGGSYAAYTAYALTLSTPDSVAALVSQVPAMGPHRVKFDPGGVLRLAEHANWWLEHAEASTSRPGLLARHPDVLDRLPVSGLAEHFWPRLPGWWPAVRPWTVPGEPPPPEAVTDAELAAVAVPTLHVGGWHDLLVTETLHHWRTIPGATLRIGPWGHDLAPLGGVLVDWIRAALTGQVRPDVVGLLGEDGWRTDPVWPEPVEWLSGGVRRFTHDPLRPFPSTVAGADRRALDARDDAARYRGPALARPLVLLGSPRVRLDAHTSAAGTDWIAKLVHRRADGGAVELASGMVVAGPGRGEHTVELSPAGVRLPAGSALELHVTSADFPNLARNLGTGEDRYTGTAVAVAEQTVHSVAVELPILEDA
ncbi:CocE/NonD family hydrolase [Amycolatopsis suaedae]|uniref:CocE/NonD family hydrolase n=1 Tax=Amycolatopsis suaedae TaxID=2510978 RepID=A0A4Q7JA91_9PSEU|nr:CocE/NonD family hydrolase [Amycolatopsis suaedae]RZQ64720.1 CocE/NonD family hydrolase [Amycolatopsis suaedae]